MHSQRAELTTPEGTVDDTIDAGAPALAGVAPADSTAVAGEATLAAAGEGDDPANLGDFLDSLRGRMAPAPDAEPQVLLPLAALELFERAAQDYERESGKLADRRHRIGGLIYPATPEQAHAASDFFSRRLGLRVVDLDARSFSLLSDEDAKTRLATLAEPTAHIVALRGLRLDSDPRVFAAIESAQVDVLVLGYAEPGAKFSPGVQRALRYRIDLLPAQPLEYVVGGLDGSALGEGRPDGPAERGTGGPPKKGQSVGERLWGLFRPSLRAAQS